MVEDERPSKVRGMPWWGLLVLTVAVLTFPFWASTALAGVGLFAFTIWLVTRKPNAD